jgi:antitoxin component of RelBE/YafQ-DinJ toxin-antitoxin module
MKAQLNVRLDQALVQQAQKAAKKEGRTLAACVAMALERWLAAASSAPPEPLLTSRLDDLERRLERLEQQKEKVSASRKPSAPATRTPHSGGHHPPIGGGHYDEGPGRSASNEARHP